MRLKVDTSGMTFLCAVPPEPVIDLATKRPKTDEAGVPVFAVRLVAMADGGAEVITAKVAGKPDERVVRGAPVRLVGLTASPWSTGKRSGVAFRAERIEPISGPQRAA